MEILIKNPLIVTPGAVPRRADVLLKDGVIEDVGRQSGPADLTIKADGMLLMPGMGNTHTHAAMALLRGYGDDMQLQEWLETKIWPAEARLEPEDIYWGTRLACLEMLRTGTTAFTDMYFHVDQIARAAQDMGMRAVVSHAYFDFLDASKGPEVLAEARKAVESLRNFPETVSPALGPHAVYTVSIETLSETARLAEEMDVKVSFHLAETEKEVTDFRKRTGKGIVEALEECGLLSERLIAAHSVWLTHEEIRVLAEHRVNVAHNPVSNMKLTVGRAMPWKEMYDAGVNVALATDGCASNNNLNMFEEMKFAALLQKFTSGDPTLAGTGQVLEMATSRAYRAMGINGGRIERGCVADVVLINRRQPELVPCHSVVSNLVYAFNGPVDTVIINGKVVLEDGVHPEQEKIMEEAGRRAERLVSQAPAP